MKAECPICLEPVALDAMHFFWCGHGCCLVCQPRMPKCAYNCPAASNSASSKRTHKIYVSLVPEDPTTEKVAARIERLVEHLHRMNHTYPSEAIRNAGNRVKEVVKASGEAEGMTPELAKALNSAARDLTKRLSSAVYTPSSKTPPSASSADPQPGPSKEEVETLQQHVRERDRQLRKQGIQLARLQTELENCKLQLDDANTAVERQRRAISEKERQVMELKAREEDLKEQVGEEKRRARAQRAKAKALAKSSRRPEPLSDPDDSLIILSTSYNNLDYNQPLVTTTTGTATASTSSVQKPVQRLIKQLPRRAKIRDSRPGTLPVSSSSRRA